MPIVTAIGMAVGQESGDPRDARLQAAINAEIHRCLADGLSADGDADVIRDRMKAAHEAELQAINEGR
jgi:hypothetical protein